MKRCSCRAEIGKLSQKGSRRFAIPRFEKRSPHRAARAPRPSLAGTLPSGPTTRFFGTSWRESARSAMTDTPRVLHIIHGLWVGGAEVDLIGKLSHLNREHGYANTVCCLMRRGELAEPLEAEGATV